MAEYIEREDLVRRLELSIKSWGRDCNKNAPVMVRAYEDILHKVNNLPAADVVEVVRCKDCVQYIKRELDPPFCCRRRMWVKPDGFCSYGERK